jgi:tripartite-type tricarboxylate transporter receptor subunit TctC
MKGRRLLLFVTWVLAMLMLPLSTVKAESYPTRTVTVISPFAPGSAGDNFARAISDGLAKEIGKPVVVESKLGAAGSVATAAAARAKPDGYTLLFASKGTLVVNQLLYTDVGYDSEKDFDMIALLGGLSNMLVVRADSPFSSVQDVVNAVKRGAPEKYSYSSSGSGSSIHMAGVVFGQKVGTMMLHVPYKGATAGLTALLGGYVDMGFYSIPIVEAQVRAGQLKPLGVTSKTRSVIFPNVPTIAESGLAGYDETTWLGFVAPKGTPKEIISYLHEKMQKIVETPEIREKLIKQGYDINPYLPVISPAAFTRLLSEDLAKWPAIIKASGAEVN